MRFCLCHPPGFLLSLPTHTCILFSFSVLVSAAPCAGLMLSCAVFWSAGRRPPLAHTASAATPPRTLTNKLILLLSWRPRHNFKEKEENKRQERTKRAGRNTRAGSIILLATSCSAQGLAQKSRDRPGSVFLVVLSFCLVSSGSLGIFGSVLLPCQLQLWQSGSRFCFGTAMRLWDLTI